MDAFIFGTNLIGHHVIFSYFLVILIGFSNRQKSFYSVNSNQDVSRRGEHLIRAMHRFCG